MPFVATRSQHRLRRLMCLFGIVTIIASMTVASETASAQGVKKSPFGETADGQKVHQFVLTNSHGLEARVMTLGATLLSVKAPDREGRLDNVTLYLDTLDDYLRGHPLFGSVVGRFANRIAGAKFSIDGTEIPIERNAGMHHIHGGKQGFQKLVWNAAPLETSEAAGVELRLTSPDGDAGYPGKLTVVMRYILTDANELKLEYLAETTKPTVVNLTNHAYWNLAGAGSGNVLDHQLIVNASQYLPSDEQRIPTGEIRDVAGTPMDFRSPQRIGSRINQVEGENYDHCYVLTKEGDERLSLCARAVDLNSGRSMEVYTTQPGVQLYTAKALSDRYQAAGKPYGPYHGFCLETQNYPDAPNQPHFPSAVLRPGEKYHQITIHKFGVVD